MEVIYDWLSAGWWTGVGVIVPIVIAVAGAIMRKNTPKGDESDDTKSDDVKSDDVKHNDVKPISNEQRDAKFDGPVTVKLPRWRIDIDESSRRFVLTNVGNGTARKITVKARMNEIPYTKKWPTSTDSIVRMDPADSEKLEDYEFFANMLPNLRETRQQGGQPFLDGHIEGGDNKAHLSCVFRIDCLREDGGVNEAEITIKID